jgi:hypothetical protein
VSRNPGTSVFDVALNNNGTVDVQAGTLRLVGGGDSTGSFTVAAGAILIFTSATFVLRPAAQVSGAGNVAFGSSLSDGGLTFVNVLGTYDIGGQTSFVNGTANFIRNGSTGTATFSGGTLTGLGDFTVTGLLNSMSGTMSGTGRTFANGGMQIGSGGSGGLTLDGRALDNAGRAVLVGGLSLSNGAAFNNRETGTFDIQGGNGVGSFGFLGTFNNAGLLVKSSGAGTTTVSPRFNNTGSVRVDTGMLALTGPFTNFSPGTGMLAGGSYILLGTLQFTNAHLVSNAATVVLAGPSARIVNQSGADALADFASNTAAGDFTLQGGRNLTVPGLFRNTGRLVIDAGSTFTAADGYAQADGLTVLLGGSLAAPLVDVQGGAFAGTGVVLGSVRNAGLFLVGGSGAAGVLEITGDFLQTETGTLELDIGGLAAGTQHDQLRVAGAAALDGTLAIGLLDGFFASLGDGFRVLAFGSRTGDFAARRGLDIGGGLLFEPLYDDTGLTLLTVPAP